MGAIIEQLGLDHTFFVQFAVLVILFVGLSRVYFKPFQKLIEERRKRTVEDREAAAKLVAQADTRLKEYQTRLATGQAEARKALDVAIMEAKKEEGRILGEARAEAKKIIQSSAESAATQRDQLMRSLEVEVVSMAKAISDRLLPGKG